MRKSIPALSSNRPDPVLLAFLASFQNLALSIILLTAGITFLAWLFPPVAERLPAGWDRMKCNNAVLNLLSAASLFLSRPRQSAAAVLGGRLLGWFILVIGALTFIESASGRSFHIDTVFAADRFAPIPGRMIQDVALVFVFTGFLLANIRARKSKLGRLVDVTTLLLCSVLLLQVPGYIMQHLHVIDVPRGHALSAPKALCMGLLGLLLFIRRLEYGWFSVLLGTGIAGRVARIAAPIAVSIPFALDTSQGFLIAHVRADPRLLSGIGATLLSVTSLCLVVLLCRKINYLENQVREISLRDELTGLYNRRGFYFLADQALLAARRDGDSFGICYFDLDGLKHINDTLGHDVGSAMLQEMAQLMETVFRDSGILGRVGGDEFVIAYKGDQPPAPALVASLTAAAQDVNRRSGRRYVLSYSAGIARSDADSEETLDELVERADREMYGMKRIRKSRSARPQGSLLPAES